MKVGLLSTSYPSAGDRTSGAFVEGFAKGLVARGHTVHVLAPRPRDGVTEISDEGLRVTYVDYAPRALRTTFHGAGVLDNVRVSSRAWPGLVTFPLALAFAARRHVETWDAIVSHFMLPCAIVAGAVRGRRPHLAIAHSADLHALSRLPARAHVAAHIASNATALWFVSSEGRRIFTDALGRTPETPAHVAPMGITPPARTTRAENEALYVLFLGRLVHVKGLDVLMDALVGTHGISLHVVGDGPLRASLEARALALGLEVTFHGALTDDAKWASIAGADVVAIPSRTLASGRTEGAPVVAIEAMSMGVPLVTSHVGGIPELVGDAALHVRAEDPGALRRALERLRDDASLRATLGARGLERAKPFRWTTLCADAESLLVSGTLTPQG